MKNRTIKKALTVLLCICTILFLTGCGISHRESVISEARYQKYKELTEGGMSNEDADKWLDEHTEEWHPDYKKSDSDKAEKPEKPTEEPVDFMEAICGTYLVSGTGVLTGGAVYDDEGPETTFTKLALHVSQAGDNAVQIDVEGEHAGSGEVSAESPTVSYTDSMGYEVTVTFAVTDGVAHADMRIFGDLTITDTDDYSTETITLSGDK